jgi:hypothetical protein
VTAPINCAWLVAEAAALRGDIDAARAALVAARALDRVHDPASHAMLNEALAALECRCCLADVTAYSTR